MRLVVRTKWTRMVALGLTAAVSAACSEASDPTEVPVLAGASDLAPLSQAGSFLVLGTGGSLPAALTEAGGSVAHAISEIGVAVVTSDAEDFAAALEGTPGINAVVPNIELNMAPLATTADGVALASVTSPPFTGDDDFFHDMQWGLDAIDAPEAWNTGARGAGARLAILDSGIDALHPDLAPNLNVALSTSFVPGETFDQVPIFPAFNHGTHVAGIAAAADNAFGIIGVAPEAELVAIKVLSAQTGTGDIGGVIAGLVHAAQSEADVANMSLGFSMSHRGHLFDASGNQVGEVPAEDVAAIWTAMIRAANYAHQQGVTMVASAGNSGTDGNADRDRIHIPSDLPHVISVSATAPRGWGLDPFTDLDLPTNYSNTGRSVIDLAAPGGGFDPTFLGQSCMVTFITAPCAAFDLVWSTVGAGFTFASGTSMAAAHVSGVAALVVGANGGSMHPAQVRSTLMRAADDLGQPGRDDIYGRGRVNAGATVGPS